MVPIRMTEELFSYLERASTRHGVTVSDLMREGARVLVQQLEQKDEPGKEE